MLEVSQLIVSKNQNSVQNYFTVKQAEIDSKIDLTQVAFGFYASKKFELPET